MGSFHSISSIEDDHHRSSFLAIPSIEIELNCVCVVISPTWMNVLCAGLGELTPVPGDYCPGIDIQNRKFTVLIGFLAKLWLCGKHVVVALLSCKTMQSIFSPHCRKIPIKTGNAIRKHYCRSVLETLLKVREHIVFNATWTVCLVTTR